MMEHDISRFNPSRDVSLENAGTDADSEEKTEDFGGATYALRQTELANQLQDLNKVLLAKQELAEKMGVNDEKFILMKKKYEDALNELEDEIVKLQTEKDQLNLQQRNAGSGAAGLTGAPSNKVSEMRRKRIQELEEQIGNLKKQQQEKQKLAKLNAQNEVKVKKLGDEIRTMKVAKVKLIKQMKEDSEKVRQWKLVKEKEVHQLKQKDRRAQVQLAKMERLHERRENVLRRKMEETVAVNKRLKVAMEKKKNARATRGENDKTLAGSGERVRGWISSELEVVVSAKEALKSKEQLIRDRKELNQELQRIKQGTRRTMSQDERKESDKKISDMQQELDLRNAQISDLQQQILSFNEEKEKAGDRWGRLTSMVEAKIAAQYLFDTATEMTASASMRGTEVNELKSQLDELSSIRDSLQLQLHGMKMRHEDEMVRTEREHEEKVLFLLGQLSGTPATNTNAQVNGDSPDVTLGRDISTMEERLKFQAQEIAKMSNIHDILMEREKEVATLKEELGGGQRRHSLMPNMGVSTPTNKKAAKKRVTIQPKAEERYKVEELDELFSTSSEESSDEEDDSDEEWRKTPMFKRIRQERQSLAVPKVDTKRKRRSSAFSEAGEVPDLDCSEESKRKRSSGTGCTCKSGCKNKRCSCKKDSEFCSPLCKCMRNKCANREVPGADVSEMSEMSGMSTTEDVSDVENESADTTAKLLNGTFDLPDFKIHSVHTPKRSPLKPVNRGRPDSADMFANIDSDVDATPTNKQQQPHSSFFPSPQLQWKQKKRTRLQACSGD